MKRCCVLVFAFFSLLLSFGYTAEPSFYYYDQLQAEKLPKHRCIIHMMYFPWNRQQQLLDDEMQFDHTPYFEMQKRVRGEKNSRVVMWTYSKAKSFCQKYYPEIWQALETYAARPVMYVDVLRWLVVYHFGGIYWQYQSIPLNKSMSKYLPRKKRVRLFVETIITPEFAKRMAQEPIRRGREEERIRIATQVFSAVHSKERTVKKIVNFLVDRLRTEKVSHDYDILYIAGNAALSEYYDTYGKDDKAIELTPLDQTVRLINFNARGSWRTDLPR